MVNLLLFPLMIWNRTQWNTAADGKEKRILSHDLDFQVTGKIWSRWNDSLRTGKMVSRRTITRWQYGLFWRKDHYPIWKNIS